jgi:hypothetical protein
MSSWGLERIERSGELGVPVAQQEADTRRARVDGEMVRVAADWYTPAA